RLAVDQGLGTQDSVPETQRTRLPDIGTVHVFGMRRAHRREQVVLLAGLQFALQFIGGVEVVLDGTFVATRDKDHVTDARCIGLFDRVLAKRLIHNGQHFLGLSLGRGKKSRSQAGHGEDRFVNLCEFIHRLQQFLPLKSAPVWAGRSSHYLGKRHRLLSDKGASAWTSYFWNGWYPRHSRGSRPVIRWSSALTWRRATPLRCARPPTRPRPSCCHARSWSPGSSWISRLCSNVSPACTRAPTTPTSKPAGNARSG